MPEPLTVTERVIEQVQNLSRDEQPLLADLASRLKPNVKKIAEASLGAYAEAGWPPTDGGFRAKQEHAVDLVVETLKRGDLGPFYTTMAGWGRTAAGNGLSYDRALILVRGFERSVLPFLQEAFSAGPELKLSLDAVERLYADVVVVLGAVYLDFTQQQLIHGARMRVLGQLSSGAAHSLNNLFTAIMGHTQLLLEHTRQREAREELQEIQHVATQGAQMVRRFQEMARVSGPEEIVETDINVIVRDASEITRFIWRDQAEANGIVVDVVKDLAQVPPVMARPNELREAIIALILNAIDVMPNGGIVTLRTERKGEKVLISVTDTGGGIPETAREHIFEPFFTTKGDKHVGLGLNTAASIATRHNGALTADTVPGRGSNLTLSLPVAPSVMEAQEAAVATQEVKVLIIDDEPAVRDIVTRFLAFRGYPVVVADSGPEGITLFKESKFDLVMTDLGMPGMSGWEVAKEVKRLKPQTLVVLMTGWATDLDPRKAKESGVDRVVHKPFNVDEVLELLSEAAAVREKM